MNYPTQTVKVLLLSLFLFSFSFVKAQSPHKIQPLSDSTINARLGGLEWRTSQAGEKLQEYDSRLQTGLLCIVVGSILEIGGIVGSKIEQNSLNTLNGTATYKPNLTNNGLLCVGAITTVIGSGFLLNAQFQIGKAGKHLAQTND